MISMTGSAGFIGSACVDDLLETTSEPIVTVDNLDYAGNLQNLAEAPQSGRHLLIKGDVCDSDTLSTVITKYDLHAIVIFTAECHLDRSIHDPDSFVQPNVLER